MFYIYRYLIFSFFLLVPGPFILMAQDTTRILFIGNSYTFANTGLSAPELPLRLSEMASLYGKTLITDFSGAGGVNLERTWKAGKAEIKIQQGKYDYVVIQEHSLGTIRDAEKFERYAEKFSELIRENNAVPVFYMTWGREFRPFMIDTISREYIKVAEELNAILVPCGYAWDITTSKFPDIKLYWEDQSHPRPEGVLLNTFVFYTTLFGEIPASPLFSFEYKNIQINRDTIRELMQVAYEASRELSYQIGEQ